MSNSDFFYHHKTLLITMIILLLGGISGVFILTKEEQTNQTEWIGDANEPIIEKEELNEEEPIKNETEKNLIVDIKGAVQNPNVYEVKEGTRIFELIELAGGLSKSAYTKNINLSKKVTDEMVVYIFTEEEFQKKITCPSKNETSTEITKEILDHESIILEGEITEEKDKINLNKANLEQLLKVPGIGETKAKSIIEYRNQNGEFHSVEELKEISGIKDGTYEKIKDYFTI